METLLNSELGILTQEILAFYVPLAIQLPHLREDDSFMQSTIKATATSGITDVVTEADKYMQAQIKAAILKAHPNWQFWGEEGEDNTSEFNESSPYLLVTDPIEGTNNFRNNIDDQWGSVISVIDSKTKEPVIGIVAHPTKGTFYVGIKGQGAYTFQYDTVTSELTSVTPMNSTPDEGYTDFTYNNSPHFNETLTRQVERFFSEGEVLPDDPRASEIERSRKTVQQNLPNGEKVTFLDPESGALEAVRNRGTIYFKTSNEMAAVFVILHEIGGKVTDGQGNIWTLGINTLIAARTQEDYDYLKSTYEKAVS